MMRKLYIILLFITCCDFLPAQSYLPEDVEVTLKDKNTGSSEGLTGAWFKCDTKKEANNCLSIYKKKIKEMSPDQIFPLFDIPASRSGQYEGGKIAVSMSLKGYLVVYVNGAKDEEDGLMVIPIDGKTKITKLVEVRVTGVVNINETRKYKVTITDMPGEVYGVKVELKNPITILEDYALNNGRFVLQPIVYRGCEDDSVFDASAQFKTLHSYVVDGVEYRQTQKRRMLFDEKHDPLMKWAVRKERDEMENPGDSLLLMRTRERTGFRVNDSFEKEDRKQKVNVQAYIWYEDYNIPYYKEMSCLSSCRMRDPMRFLECDSMLNSYPIENKLRTNVPEENLHYWEKPNATPIKEPGNLSLNFLTGKAELDPNDSVGIKQLADLRELLRVLSHDREMEFHGITIKGQASPDGPRARNEILGRERMLYATREATSSLKSGVPIITESVVASWNEVADTLMSDSTLIGLAGQIKDIVSSLPNRYDEQWKRIRALPEYQTKILPAAEKLRTVSYSYAYTKSRILGPEEIFERWQTNEDYRNGNKALVYYEYCYLFDYLKDDSVAMQNLAERAYKRYPKYRKYNAPWPLAAYYYAQCKLKNGICDTTILKPYIKYNLPPNYSFKFDGKEEAYYNDPAIISLQIAIKVELGDYDSAWYLTNYLPADAGTIRMRAFLGCLRGHYKEDTEERRLVINSSPINKAVIYTALNTADYNREAMSLLNDTTVFPNQKDYRVLYMKSILAARKMNGKQHAWGNPGLLLEDCPYIYDLWSLDEKYYRETLDDGEFANNVRNDFIKLWDLYKRYGDKNMQLLKIASPDIEFRSDKGKWKLYGFDENFVEYEIPEIQYE